MREYQQKNTARKMIYSKLVIFILAMLCLLMLRSINELYSKYKNVDSLEMDAEKTRDTLSEKVSKAQTRNDALQTDRGMEEYIRTTYPVVKDGEGVVVIYEASSSPVVAVKKDTSFFERIQLFFENYFNK